ncbi:MAG: NHLP bacteriocin export ABC transporter permease/ATPase subunit [Simkaniaceae bacterium]
MTKTAKEEFFHQIFAEGEIIELYEGEKIFLQDSRAVYWIENGELDLFGTESKESSFPFTEFLAGFGISEVLFSFPQKENMKVFAAALKPAKLYKLDAETFEGRIKNFLKKSAPLVSAIDNWIYKLCQNSQRYVSDVEEVLWSKDAMLELKKDEVRKVYHDIWQRKSHKVFWVRAEEGKVHINWHVESPLEASSSPLPIPEGFALFAEEDAKLSFALTEEVLGKEDFWQGLEKIHTLIFKDIHYDKEQKEKQQNRQYQLSRDLEEKSVLNASYSLASLLRQDKFILASKFAGSALVKAFQIIAKDMGEAASVPEEKELKEKSIAQTIQKISDYSEIPYRKVSLQEGFWKKDAGRFMAFWGKEQKPVALLPYKSGYQVVDPDLEKPKTLDKKVFSQLATQAYCFYRPLPEKPFGRDLLRFCIAGQGRDILIILFVSVFSALLSLYTPFAMEWIFDKAIPDKSFSLLYQIAFGFLAATISISIFHMTRDYAVLRLEGKIGNKLQAAVWDRLLKIGMPFFRSSTTGDLFQRASAIDEMRESIGGAALTTLISGPFSLFYLAVMFYHSALLSLLSLIPIVLGIIVYTIGMLATVNLKYKIYNQQGKIYSFLVEVLRGVGKIRTAHAENRTFARWAEAFAQKKKNELTIAKIDNWLRVSRVIFSGAAIIFIYFFVIHFMTEALKEGKVFLSIGKFLSFSMAFGAFSAAVFSFSITLIHVIGDVIPLWRRAKNILKEPLRPRKMTVPKIRGNITLDKIYFRYDKNSPMLLNDISLTIPSGKFAAFVGASGCGKSTLIRLLLGFEAPEKGKIYYDGMDLERLDLPSLRRQIGVVLQNGSILEGSLRENITCGRDYSDEEIVRTLDLCGFSEDLDALPMGLETMMPVGGTTLSGGQRQRVMIARALIGKPKILILDEATSALDNKTQELVKENIDRQSMTRIVIAHRLSTIVNADIIYVIENGRIVQSGTFNTLKSQSGYFRTLIERQM